MRKYCASHHRQAPTSEDLTCACALFTVAEIEHSMVPMDRVWPTGISLRFIIIIPYQLPLSSSSSAKPPPPTAVPVFPVFLLQNRIERSARNPTHNQYCTTLKAKVGGLPSGLVNSLLKLLSIGVDLVRRRGGDLSERLAQILIT